LIAPVSAMLRNAFLSRVAGAVPDCGATGFGGAGKAPAPSASGTAFYQAINAVSSCAACSAAAMTLDGDMDKDRDHHVVAGDPSVEIGHALSRPRQPLISQFIGKCPVGAHS
jgi:hypothetical protein